MMKIVSINVSVQDTDHDSYRDPSGRSVIQLYCKDIEEIEKSIGAIVNGMIHMANAEYVAEVFKRDQETKEGEA